ncbi:MULTISPECIES: hypothetical protein [unclassified Bradyrhizobium]|uniref:hypothetical protein n=1 Tax=unclassified Bradyrhizobium TaxID=2631580 RepID=UPI00042A2ED2|nr:MULTISPECIES: hypothetical protein [unclassified Bradyrhizobium]QIG98697.1 hypothetical protein G6P99_45225 [Bradyrhizobium sp. 6(2017)]
MWYFLTTALFSPDLAILLAVRAFENASHDPENAPIEPRKTGFEDPVYKKNLQRLIERNRQFEEA